MYWRRLLRVPWTARRSNLSILKEISPGCSLEGLILKLKLQYFGHLMQRADSLEKTVMLGKIEGRREEKGTTEDEMVGWHHRLDGHGFGWTPGVGDGQGAAVHQVTKSWTRLSDLTELCNVSTVLPRTKHICFMYYEKWIVWFQRVCIWICIWVKCSLIKLALSKKKMSVKIHVNNLKFLYHPLLRKHLKAKTFKSINKQTNKQTKTHIRS